jgi:hypothetical protein
LNGLMIAVMSFIPLKILCTAPTAAWRKAPLVPGTKYRMRSAA